MKQIHVLSDNQKQQKAALTTQIRALSVQTDHKMAEIKHLHVTFESRMKLQNQTMERELAAAWWEARMNLTLNS